MSDDEKKLSIALPGEWALQKAFGPALTEIGEDLKKVYAKGRDKLVAAAYRKIENKEDGKQANLRVARDILWNGSFTEDEVCAEYFGGLLASSRSTDGKDDEIIHFVDVIKSLSSRQLRLHYTIYNCLNKLLVLEKSTINVAKSAEIQSQTLWLSTVEIDQMLGMKSLTGLNILNREGLISEYRADYHPVGNNEVLPYIMVKATTFGVLLYTVAFNQFELWNSYPQTDYGDFPDVPLPNVYGRTIEEILKKSGITTQK